MQDSPRSEPVFEIDLAAAQQFGDAFHRAFATAAATIGPQVFTWAAGHLHHKDPEDGSR